MSRQFGFPRWVAVAVPFPASSCTLPSNQQFSRSRAGFVLIVGTLGIFVQPVHPPTQGQIPVTVSSINLRQDLSIVPCSVARRSDK